MYYLNRFYYLIFFFNFIKLYKNIDIYLAYNLSTNKQITNNPLLLPIFNVTVICPFIITQGLETFKHSV